MNLGLFSEQSLDQRGSGSRLPVETFSRLKRGVQRSIQTSDGRTIRSQQTGSDFRVNGDLGADFDQAWLRTRLRRPTTPRKPTESVRVVDLFTHDAIEG